MPEITHLRAWVQSNFGNRKLYSDWVAVSQPYPDETARIAVDKWNVDPSTGTVDFDLTASATGLAQAGALCESNYCMIGVDGGRAPSEGSEPVVATTVCSQSGWSGYEPWTLSKRCQASGAVLPEITHVRPWVLSNFGSKRLYGSWIEVADLYPEEAATINVALWQVDHATGKVNYSFDARATGLAQAGATCESNYCMIGVDGGRTPAGATEPVVVSTICSQAQWSTYGPWSLAKHCEGAGIVMPEITKVRTWVRSNFGSKVLVGPWVTVGDSYPAAEVSITSRQWDVDPATGKVDFDISAVAVGLAGAGAMCETDYCIIGVDAGRVPEGGVAPMTISTVCSQQPWSGYGPWTLAKDCQGSGVVMPEVTYVRAWVLSDFGGKKLFSEWLRIADAYPEERTHLAVDQWEVDEATGSATYDLTASAVGLAQGGALCENDYCVIGIDGGWSDGSGSLPIKTEEICSQAPWSSYGPWTLSQGCEAQGRVMHEVTHLRVWVASDFGAPKRLEGPWLPVHKSYGAPAASLDVARWSLTDEDGNNGAYLNYDVSANVTGLARAGGPCEFEFCSVRIEGGMPDPGDGSIHATSAMATDGNSTLAPGQWSTTLRSYSESGFPVLVPDQEYSRVAVYAGGTLAFATDWQRVSTLGGADQQMAMLASAVLSATASSTSEEFCFTFAEGTHVVGMSPSDQQLACDQALSLGRSRLRIIARLAASLGTAYIRNSLFETTGQVVPTDFPTPQTDPPSSLSLVASVQRRLASSEFVNVDGQRTRVVVTRGVAAEMQKRCAETAGVEDDCGGIAIFSPGGQASPQAAQHDLDAISNGKPSVLTYASRGPNTNWYRKVDPCKDYDGTLFDCDEYPFWATTQGGEGASLKVIDLGDNQAEGRQFGAFLTVCKIASAPEGDSRRDFLVLPIPARIQPTTYACLKE